MAKQNQSMRRTKLAVRRGDESWEEEVFEQKDSIEVKSDSKSNLQFTIKLYRDDLSRVHEEIFQIIANIEARAKKDKLSVGWRA